MLLLRNHLLFTGDRSPRTFLGPCVGMGALTAYRQTLAMTPAAVGPDVHEPLDVHGDLGPQRTFDFDFPLDNLAESRDFGIGQIPHPGVGTDRSLVQNPLRSRQTDAKNVRERDL